MLHLTKYLFICAIINVEEEKYCNENEEESNKKNVSINEVNSKQKIIRDAYNMSFFHSIIHFFITLKL